jgi:hypothetical protein
MQTTNINLKHQIQGVYERAYINKKQTIAPNEVHIGIQSGGHDKVFVERNFYFCGFNSIQFKAIGKNRELVPYARKSYPSGFYLKVDELGNRGNGDFEIQTAAYQEVVNFLTEEGYTVYLESRLD